MEGYRHKIPGDGSCMYNSILFSLRHHPVGNLMHRSPFMNVNQLTGLIVSHPRWKQGWTNIYDVYCGAGGNGNGNAAAKREARKEMQSDPRWVLKVFSSKRCITLEKFLEKAEGYVRHPTLDSDTWGGEIEFDTIRDILAEYDIRLEFPIPDETIPDFVDFGTTREPSIFVVYNGVHYDSYVPRGFETNKKMLNAAAKMSPWNEVGMTKEEYEEAVKNAKRNEAQRNKTRRADANRTFASQKAEWKRHKLASQADEAANTTAKRSQTRRVRLTNRLLNKFDP
jgi:hypothetical protein